MISSYQKFVDNYALGSAFISKTNDHESKVKKFFYRGLYTSYYLINKKKRLE
jgi:hypothetical protein